MAAPWDFIEDIYDIYIYSLWLFNIAMEAMAHL
jgi:hypothetical protein